MMPSISITTSAWTSIGREIAAVDKDGLETGGILLGHDDGSNIRIAVAGDPGPNAVRTADRFLRDREHAQRIATDAWESGRAQWVGEWHTHPNTAPVPSDIDLASYMNHLADDELGFTRFVSIIIGVAATGQIVVATWVVTPDSTTLVPLRRLKEGPT